MKAGLHMGGQSRWLRPGTLAVAPGGDWDLLINAWGLRTPWTTPKRFHRRLPLLCYSKAFEKPGLGQKGVSQWFLRSLLKKRVRRVILSLCGGVSARDYVLFELLR